MSANLEPETSNPEPATGNAQRGTPNGQRGTLDGERSAGNRTSVIIPAFNEGKNIGAVVRRVRELYPGFDVLVIDDGSVDDTAAAAREAGAAVYRHPYNIGNGAAVKSGIRRAAGEILVIMDGDGQHDPADIAALVAHLPEYDMAVGARSREDQASMGRFVGNLAFNRMASYVAKFKVLDLTSGFRAVKAEVARNFLYLLPNTYSYPTTLTLGVLRNGLSLKYVPVRIHRRTQGSSNIRVFRDGVRFFMIITKICTLYSPMRVFLPASFLMFLAGGVNYAFTYFTRGRFTNMSTLMFVTSILIFMLGLISEQISQMRVERSEEECGGRRE